mmetsp:Transcript_5984/g.13086  ORF Transcript_5984/g.13086 Transcript_5984/m.13086 type:complete len:90 (-) Transcript_5984:396-665(-)
MTHPHASPTVHTIGPPPPTPHFSPSFPRSCSTHVEFYPHAVTTFSDQLISLGWQPAAMHCSTGSERGHVPSAMLSLPGAACLLPISLGC